MTRAISRDSFNELKQYLGVHLQQGRVILDSDWNEGQDIMATLSRRLGQDALRDGVVNEGFEIEPVIPVPRDRDWPFRNAYVMAGLPIHLQFPTAAPFETFDTLNNWTTPPAPAKLRISRDRPYEGKTFLRLSDHAGPVTLTKTLPAAVDLSTFQFAHFRFRLNQTFPLPPAPLPGTASFFVMDSANRRNVYKLTGLWNAKDMWTPAAALPLDLRFHIVDLDLLPAFVGKVYASSLVSMGAPSAVTWSVPPNTLPTGLSLVTQPNSNYARITGTPTIAGTFTFTITATAGTAVTRTFTMRVQAPPAFPVPFDGASLATDVEFFWESFRARTTKPDGQAANLSAITKFGFEVFQRTPPLVWDFDALHFGSRSLVNSQAANNFLISGPLQNRLFATLQTIGMMEDLAAVQADDFSLVSHFQATFDRRPRVYAGGLACTQTRDMLYSEQADPNDPSLAPPGGTTVRKDLVYLDVWREPVTYVEDPDLREIALGGPDTSTRMRVRQRVRVAQNGALPTGDGTGLGTLATEGSYGDTSNRLYLVEVDTAGDIGTATVRWSDDNGSTIQRVIETIPPNATKVKVEDASAFQPGDFVLLRKEFKDEEHRVAGVFGNTITLQEPTGSTTTFALADRPKVQRWNGFHAPIAADTNDPTVSAAINLSFGVKVRFGGRALRKGDYWTFRTRYLAGDDAAGISATARIETVDFQLPQGVVHQYTPLGLLIRDGAADEPNRIKLVRDQRKHAGQVVFHRGTFIGVALVTGTAAFPIGMVDLGFASAQSAFLCIWTGTINAQNANTALRLDVTFFDNRMTNPDNLTGAVDTRSTTIACVTPGSNAFSTVVLGAVHDAGTFLVGAERVAARAFITLLTNTGTSNSVGGQLDIIEVRNELLKLPNLSEFID